MSPSYREAHYNYCASGRRWQTMTLSCTDVLCVVCWGGPVVLSDSGIHCICCCSFYSSFPHSHPSDCHNTLVPLPPSMPPPPLHSSPLPLPCSGPVPPTLLVWAGTPRRDSSVWRRMDRSSFTASTGSLWLRTTSFMT